MAGVAEVCIGAPLLARALMGAWVCVCACVRVSVCACVRACECAFVSFGREGEGVSGMHVFTSVLG